MLYYSVINNAAQTGGNKMTVYRVLFRNKTGQTCLRPERMNYLTARRLVRKNYPRTGCIYTENMLITIDRE